MSKQTTNLTTKLQSLPKGQRILIYAAVFAAIGILLLAITKAAGPFVSVEPENATLTSSASVGSDASASGGQYVRLGSSSPSGWVKPSWLVAGMSWQWQLDGTIDTSFDVAVYDIDYEIDQSTVSTLQGQGKKVICYVAVGSAEDFRPDYSQFPASVLGRSNGWPGEKWLDIRQISILQPIMEARFDICKSKGFDAIEPDLQDGYSNNTGFPLTYADQIAYNTMIADIAHDRGLAVGLKNDVEQAGDLEPIFDFSVNEECAAYDECAALAVFTDNNKPVFHAEYSVSVSKMCTASVNYNLSSIKKNLSLDAPILGSCY